MPRTVKIKKISNTATKDSHSLETQEKNSINSSHILYSLLLLATFLVGYLLARVQNIENSKNTPATGTPIAAQTTPQAQDKKPVGKVSVENGHLPVEGKKDAKVTIVEFADFECPFCEKFYSQALIDIRKDYINTGKVKLYYRHFTLPFHNAAIPGALASECANEQGKFWEYHDMVYKNQTKITGGGENANASFKQFALDLGLNADQFNQCFDSQKYKDLVDKDQKDGQAAGVSGTPSFFINGTQIVGAQPYAAFKTAIDKELQ